MVFIVTPPAIVAAAITQVDDKLHYILTLLTLLMAYVFYCSLQISLTLTTIQRVLTWDPQVGNLRNQAQILIVNNLPDHRNDVIDVQN